MSSEISELSKWIPVLSTVIVAIVGFKGSGVISSFQKKVKILDSQFQV
jgi:hypothetical protein